MFRERETERVKKPYKYILPYIIAALTTKNIHWEKFDGKITGILLTL